MSGKSWDTPGWASMPVCLILLRADPLLLAISSNFSLTMAIILCPLVWFRAFSIEWIVFSDIWGILIASETPRIKEFQFSLQRPTVTEKYIAPKFPYASSKAQKSLESSKSKAASADYTAGDKVDPSYHSNTDNEPQQPTHHGGGVIQKLSNAGRRVIDYFRSREKRRAEYESIWLFPCEIKRRIDEDLLHFCQTKIYDILCAVKASAHIFGVPTVALTNNLEISRGCEINLQL